MMPGLAAGSGYFVIPRLSAGVSAACGHRNEPESSMTNTATYDCPVCGTTYPADRPIWRCACGSHLNLAPGPGLGRSDIDGAEASLWRYRAGLALSGPPKVSLGEGWTPLVIRDWDGAPVH